MLEFLLGIAVAFVLFVVFTLLYQQVTSNPRCKMCGQKPHSGRCRPNWCPTNELDFYE